MADAFTKNYNWTKPDIGASDDTWGDKWNANLDAIDAQMQAEADKVGVPEPPDNQTYGRAAGAWNLVVPQAGGTFTGPVSLSAGGAVTGGGLTFVGSAALSVPAPAQFTLGGGSAGWALTTDGAGTLSWAPVTTGGPYVPISGATMTGALIMQGSNMIALNSPLASGQSAIIGQKAGINRWQLMLGDYTAEGLNNVGSNFSLSAFSTTGATLGTWLTINRADGSTTFSGAGVTIASGLAVNGLLAITNVGNLSIPGGSPGQFLQTNGAGVLSWGGAGAAGVPEAPNDSTSYARRVTSGVGAWTHLTHTDITDWTASLAGYALTTSVPVASTSTPLMDGTAAVGASLAFARGDHVHPTDTSRAAVSALPPASTTTPLADGTAAVGTSTAYARADHVHPAPAADPYPHDNRIINGDMRIDQRNSGSSGTAVGYTVDRWQFSATLATKGVWTRSNLLAGTSFPYCLAWTSSSAYTPLAGDTFCFLQPIEADMVSDLVWGTASAQPVTLSFVAFCTVGGTFGGSIRNAASTRSYPFTYSLSASTMTKISITIPGDTAGTWVMSGNAAAVQVAFDLGTGTTYRGPANAWAGTQYNGATGSVNVCATNGATFAVTGVKLEIGSVATPYNRQSLAKSMADCQRYYQTFGGVLLAPAANVASLGGAVFSGSLLVAMRASPTLTTALGSGTSWVGALSSAALSVGAIQVWAGSTQTVAGAFMGFSGTATAEL